MSMLLDSMPAVLKVAEEDLLHQFINEFIKNPKLAWKQVDLEEWLMEEWELDEYAADNLSGNLIDYMLEQELGYDIFDSYQGEGFIYHGKEY